MGFLSLARERDVMKKKMLLREKISYLLFSESVVKFRPFYLQSAYYNTQVSLANAA